MNIQQITTSASLSVITFCMLAVAPTFAQTITHVPFTFRSGIPFDGFASRLSGAGDINGDGFDDLIIAAVRDNQNGTNSGNVRVVSGGTGEVLFTFSGDSAGDRLGGSVSGVGDVNGDGVPDVFVGASGDNNFIRAQVFSGADGSVIHEFLRSGLFGFSVSGAGDVNGDGVPDLIAGNPSANINGNSSGSAQVLSGVDGEVLYEFSGDSAADFFGQSVSGAGDVNGDGFADVIVGAPGDDTNGSNSGRARVFSGFDGSILYNIDGNETDNGVGTAISGAGDVNGDGFDDLIVGIDGDSPNGPFSGSARVISGATGAVLYNFEGDQPLDRFGSSVSGAGDVNDDGFDDLIVGASEDTNSNDRNGHVMVFSGADGSVLYSFGGDEPGDLFGISVSGAGDINGDGVDDFIAGAVDSSGGSPFGYARVFISQVTEPVLLGDCNQDGEVTFLDIAPFIAILTADSFLEEADTNQDDRVGFLDIAPLIAILAG